VKKILFVLSVLITSSSFSQINFEKGYFIDNLGAKTDCYIKNIDWNLNPDTFDYKLELDDEAITQKIHFVKEFGVFQGHVYKRAIVEIDRSSEEIAKIGFNKNPVFKTETLFLRVLVDGNASLLSYKDRGLTRFFYTSDDSTIEQLVYKVYKSGNSEVSENNSYKSQLWNILRCEKIKSNQVRNLKYKRADLIAYFLTYNQVCQNTEALNLDRSQENKDFLNLSLRPGLISSSLRIINSSNASRPAQFDNQLNFRLGLELEYVLPYNKNKWSVFIEPTYQSYSGKDNDYVYATDILQNDFITSVETTYQSLELPLGFRHHMFLKGDSKLFIDIAYVYDFPINSIIVFKDTFRDDLEIGSKSNLALGLGYAHKGKYSLQLKYYSPRNILENYLNWRAEYQSISVIIGYNFL